MISPFGPRKVYFWRIDWCTSGVVSIATADSEAMGKFRPMMNTDSYTTVFRAAIVAACLLGLGAIGFGWRTLLVDDPFWGLAWIGPGIVTTSISWSPFGEAGIAVGDELVSIDGRQPREMPRLLQDAAPGDEVTITLNRGGAERTAHVQLTDMPAMRRFAQGEKLVLAFLLLAVGVVVGLWKPDEQLTRAMAVLGVIAALALATNVVRLTATNGLRISTLLELAAIGVTVHTYSYLVPRRSAAITRSVLIALYGTMGVAIAASVFVPLFIRDANTLAYWWRFQNSAIFWLMAIYLGAALFMLLQQTRESAEMERRRRIVAVGLAVALGPSLLLSIAPQAVTGEPLIGYVWTHPFFVLAPLSLGYAVLHGRKGSIDRAAHSIATVGAALMLLLPVAIPLFYLLFTRWNTSPMLGAAVGAAVSVGVGVLFGWLINILRPRIDRIVFGGMHGYRALVNRISADLDSSDAGVRLRPLELLDVLGQLGRALSLNLESYLLPAENGESAMSAKLVSQDGKHTLSGTGPVCLYLARHGRPVWQRDLATTIPADERAVTASLIGDTDNWLWVPLIAEHRLSGIALFRAASGAPPLSADDLETLATVAGRIALHMRNAELHRSLARRLTQVEQYRDELAEAQRRIAKERENERSRLARELHDGPLQMMFGIGYKLDALDGTNVDKPDRRNMLKETKKALRDVSSTIRGICSTLRPPMLSDFGIDSALKSLGTNIQHAHPEVHIRYELMPERRPLAVDIRLALYRIAQEAIGNAVRHGKAEHIVLRFEHDIEQILLEVEDDGVGFSVPDSLVSLTRENHFGLLGIEERAAGIGGQLHIESIEGTGTVIRVLVPDEDGAADGDMDVRQTIANLGEPDR